MGYFWLMKGNSVQFLDPAGDIQGVQKNAL